MKVWVKYSNKLLLLLAVFLAASVSIRADGLDATATYTDMQVSPGVFQYDLTLKNTGPPPSAHSGSRGFRAPVSWA